MQPSQRHELRWSGFISAEILIKPRDYFVQILSFYTQHSLKWWFSKAQCQLAWVLSRPLMISMPAPCTIPRRAPYKQWFVVESDLSADIAGESGVWLGTRPVWACLSPWRLAHEFHLGALHCRKDSGRSKRCLWHASRCMRGQLCSLGCFNRFDLAAFASSEYCRARHRLLGCGL